MNVARHGMTNPLQAIYDKMSEIKCVLERLLNAQTGEDPNVIRTVKTINQKSNILVNHQVLVASTPSSLISANQNRISIIVQNRGVDNLYLGSDNNVDINSPIGIASGETWSSDTYQGQLYGISDGGSLDIRVQEEVV